MRVPLLIRLFLQVLEQGVQVRQVRQRRFRLGGKGDRRPPAVAAAGATSRAGAVGQEGYRLQRRQGRRHGVEAAGIFGGAGVVGARRAQILIRRAGDIPPRLGVAGPRQRQGFLVLPLRFRQFLLRRQRRLVRQPQPGQVVADLLDEVERFIQRRRLLIVGGFHGALDRLNLINFRLVAGGNRLLQLLDDFDLFGRRFGTGQHAAQPQHLAGLIGGFRPARLLAANRQHGVADPGAGGLDGVREVLPGVLDGLGVLFGQLFALEAVQLFNQRQIAAHLAGAGHGVLIPVVEFQRRQRVIGQAKLGDGAGQFLVKRRHGPGRIGGGAGGGVHGVRIRGQVRDS